MISQRSSPLFQTVAGESWASLFKVVIGVWLMVWLFAAVHNQYLIRIQPEHFTVWHYKMPLITNHTLLAIAYAGGASISPGLVLGTLLFVTGRLFNRPKISARRLVLSTVWVWIAVEICALTAGLVVHITGRGFYPSWLYPSDDEGLLITQSIQITAYLAGIFFSILLLVRTWQQRKPC